MFDPHRNVRSSQEYPTPCSPVTFGDAHALRDRESIPSVPSCACSSSATTAFAATTAAGAFCLGPRFVDVDGASANLRSIQRFNRLVAFFGITHLDETEATRAASLAIGENADAVNCSIGCEDLAQFIFRRVKTQVPNENVFQGALFSVFANR